MTDQTDTQEPAAPGDPDAPTRHTLPSGKVVEVRSHRTLDGSDVALALASHSGGAAGVVNMRNCLIQRMVTEIEPGRAGKPTLDGSLEAILAQRADDYRRLYTLVDEGWKLALGLSVIPDLDEFEDPKAPTAGTSGSRPDSGDDGQP